MSRTSCNLYQNTVKSLKFMSFFTFSKAVQWERLESLIVLRALWLKKNIYFLILIISLSVLLEIVSEIKDPITHPVLRGSNAEWNMLVGRLKSNRLCYSSGLHLCEGFKMHWDNEPKHASKLWRPNKIKGVLTPRSPDPDLALSWRLKKITLLAWQVAMCFSSSHSDDMQVCS